MRREKSEGERVKGRGGKQLRRGGKHSVMLHQVADNVV